VEFENNAKVVAAGTFKKREDILVRNAPIPCQINPTPSQLEWVSSKP
jgi:hypothetical protein